MSISKFECPCCGAELTFSAGAQKMVCDYCGTQLEADAVQELTSSESVPQESYNWNEYSKTEMNMGEGTCAYVCNSCGAEIAGDKSLAASECPYCGSPVIMNDKLDGMLKPDFIIPFKVDKEKAVEKFKQFCSHRPLLPSDFISTHRIENIQGTYVPYWLFDCDCDARIRFAAERITSWSEGDEDVTRTDHYLLIRHGSMAFEHVPVDGTTKLDADITEAVEPFASNEAVSFNSAYLSGYLADKYDTEASECRPRANERIKRSAEDILRRTTDSYTTVRAESERINITDGKVSYALLPMWIMTAKYGDKKYTFAMNGQTGRFVGELPISWGKFWGMLLGIGAGLSVLFIILINLLAG